MTYDGFRQGVAAALDALEWTPVAGAIPDPRAPSLPYITHTGVLTLAGVGPIPCYQLNTGERVVDGPTVERLFGLDAEDEDLDDAGAPKA